MKKVRFSSEEPARFEDRDGRYVLVSGFTLVENDSGGLVFGGTTGGEVFHPEEASKEDSGHQDEGGVGDQVSAIWTTYVEVMQPRNADLHPDERRIIRDALKVASPEECQAAIKGCKASGWHMGDNPQGRKYNRLSQILKAKRSGAYGGPGRTTREQIDFFIDQLARTGGLSGFTSDAIAKIEVLKDRVRRRTSRAEEAKATLKERYGIDTVEGEHDGRQHFTFETTR